MYQPGPWCQQQHETARKIPVLTFVQQVSEKKIFSFKILTIFIPAITLKVDKNILFKKIKLG